MKMLTNKHLSTLAINIQKKADYIIKQNCPVDTRKLIKSLIITINKDTIDITIGINALNSKGRPYALFTDAKWLSAKFLTKHKKIKREQREQKIIKYLNVEKSKKLTKLQNKKKLTEKQSNEFKNLTHKYYHKQQSGHVKASELISRVQYRRNPNEGWWSDIVVHKLYNAIKSLVCRMAKDVKSDNSNQLSTYSQYQYERYGYINIRN